MDYGILAGLGQGMSHIGQLAYEQKMALRKMEMQQAIIQQQMEFQQKLTEQAQAFQIQREQDRAMMEDVRQATDIAARAEQADLDRKAAKEREEMEIRAGKYAHVGGGPKEDISTKALNNLMAEIDGINLDPNGMFGILAPDKKKDTQFRMASSKVELFKDLYPDKAAHADFYLRQSFPELFQSESEKQAIAQQAQPKSFIPKGSRAAIYAPKVLKGVVKAADVVPGIKLIKQAGHAGKMGYDFLMSPPDTPPEDQLLSIQEYLEKNK